MAHVYPHESLKVHEDRARPAVFLGFAGMSSTPLVGTWVRVKSKLAWRVQENDTATFCEGTLVHSVDLLKPDPQQANRFAGLEFDAGCTQLPSPVAPARLIPGAAAPGLGEGYDHVHSDDSSDSGEESEAETVASSVDQSRDKQVDGRLGS